MTTTAPQQTTTATSTDSSGRRPLAVAWGTNFLVGLALYMVTPLMPSIGRDYGLTPSGMGLMATGFSVAYFLSALVLGSLAQRVGQRRMLVGAVTLFAIACLATAVAPSYGWVIAARVLAGAAAGAASPTLYALTSIMAPPERRGRWLAVTVSGLLSALWAGAPVGALLVDHIGWKAVFAGVGVIAAVLALVNQKVWPGGVLAVPDAPKAEISKGYALIAVSVWGLWAAAVYGLYTFLGIALDGDSAFHGTEPWLLAAYGVGAVAGIFLGGRWADRHGPARILTTALLVLTVLELALAALFRAGNPVAFGVGLLLFAFTAFAGFPAQATRLVQLFPAQATTVLAWNASALFVGISAASAVGGAVIGHYSYPVFLVCCSVAALLATGLSRISPTKSGSEDNRR